MLQIVIVAVERVFGPAPKAERGAKPGRSNARRE
jgi:hypothetical protein